jgi:glycyl-tRNA synthetase (class II)
MNKSPDAQRMEKIVSLCKRRGFIFQSSEIYGGLNGAWDYGPLGVELKRNLKNYWWRVMVHERDDVAGLDGAILTHPAVLKASGHVDAFTDPMVDCRLTQRRFRADQVPVQSGTVYRFDQARDAIPPESAFKILVSWTEELLPAGESVSRKDSIRLALLVSDHRKFNLPKPKAGPLSVYEFFIEFANKMSTQPDISNDDVENFRKAYASDPEVSGDSIRLLQRKGEDKVTILKRADAFYHLRNILIPIVSPSIEDVTDSREFNPDNGAELTPPRPFNLMFRTSMGATEGEDSIAYLRPETAQSIFVQFKNVLEVSRKKLPFGIAQIGKAFRNEINPRNFTFRSREFEQMELEYFCRAEEGMKWLDYWLEERLKFYENIGIPREKLHAHEIPDEERAFYSKGTYDIEFDFPFGRQELEGVAYRTDYDLQQHIKASGKPLDYFDEETKQRFIPHVVEPSAGVDRTVLALICEAYDEDTAPDEKGKLETRIVLRFHPRMAPIKCAVFPLLKNKEPLVAKAKEIANLLRPHMNVFYDEGGAIGRRYRRQDEIGTPFAVTVDFETLGEKDPTLRGTVTLRDRDSMKQQRVPITELVSILTSRIR